jgi:hypothetical protein
MHNLRKLLFETLACLGAKKNKESFEFLEPDLLIKHKDAGVKYTVKKVGISSKDKKPIVIAYRYYGPSNKKHYIEIHVKDFNKYEPV